jgi:hypothetical protein
LSVIKRLLGGVFMGGASELNALCWPQCGGAVVRG